MIRCLRICVKFSESANNLAAPTSSRPSSLATLSDIPISRGDAEQEEDDPKARPVRGGVNARAGRARQRMANQYEKRGEIVEFEAGDYCTIKVPRKDRPVMLSLCESLRESYDGLVISTSELAKEW